MDITPNNYIKKNKINLEDFREKYRLEIDYIYNNYIEKMLENNELPVVDKKILYYDIIKFFYLTSI